MHRTFLVNPFVLRCVSSVIPCYSSFRRLAYHESIRKASTSTIVGQSGHIYVQGEVLQRREDPKRSIFKAESENESSVLKRVSKWYYDRSLRIAAEFAGSRRLRMHIDCNPEDCILIYPYFTTTLLSLIQDDPDLPPPERVKIMRCTGEGIQELHSKDWIHIDIKPDNILVNWTCDEHGNKTVTDVALGDFDIAYKFENPIPWATEVLYTPHPIGNTMWRSPEGQTGRGMSKASEIFSFGLVCIYVLGGGELLTIKNYSELVKDGISPEQEIMTRHFCYFGPVSDGLLKYINDENWSKALIESSETAGREVGAWPEMRFENWGKGFGATQDMIAGMTKIDPTARITIEQVLAHLFWQEFDRTAQSLESLP